MAKREPLSKAELDYLVRRKETGGSHRQVAEELHCSAETVRKKWQAHRRGQLGRKRGRPGRGVLSQYPVELVERAITLKRAHPHWGPAQVRVELQDQTQLTEQQLPSMSRLSVLFKERCPDAVQPRHPRAKPTSPPALRVHQRWQIDAVEKICLRAGQFASVLDIREPVGALMIGSRAFRTTKQVGQTWRKLTLNEVRHSLRLAFASWGMPAEIQTDNESLFVGIDKADFPTVFTLWLVGLGIGHHLSHPAKPTEQGAVERNHRTQGDMSWKDTTYDEVCHLQLALDQSNRRYNQQLPVKASQCHGKPPLVVQPEAAHTGRNYDPALEYELFDLAAVDHYLANHEPWTRKTDKNGVLWLGSHTYYLSRDIKNRQVTARYLPDKRSFSFTCQSDGTVFTRPALGLSKSELTGLAPLALPPVFQYPLPLMGV